MRTNKEIRDEALRQAMWRSGQTNNDITRYIADAVVARVMEDDETEKGERKMATDAMEEGFVQGLESKIDELESENSELRKCMEHVKSMESLLNKQETEIEQLQDELGKLEQDLAEKAGEVRAYQAAIRIVIEGCAE